MFVVEETFKSAKKGSILIVSVGRVLQDDATLPISKKKLKTYEHFGKHKKGKCVHFCGKTSRPKISF